MSKVYFSDFNAKFGDDILRKFERLIVAAGIDDIDFEDKFVAIKVHFGEWGNMAFLRQQYAKVLADHIKERGGKVFLTDASTLYAGFRGNAVDHLYDAAWNGYSQAIVGCPVIIADGLRGTDERIIDVEGAKYCKQAKIAAAVAEADVIISLTHCKGHENAGFGGTLKNLGMGCGSKHGKMAMHSASIPVVYKKACIGCGNCVKACANDGIHIIDHKAVIDEEHCLGCANCFAYCTKGALSCKWDEAPSVLSEKIAEYTKAALNGKPQFHISIASDIQPNCDCNGGRKTQLVPDVGMFASFDPISIDQAAADAINRQPIMPGNPIAEKVHDHDHKDVFHIAHPDTSWESGIIHGENLGLGERKYEIITVK
ncbi:MAG: DUF362 domain-containing protein [Bacillota bacterium]|nr:DUF362 domain-containing protein [Bacillota bacterium]